MSYYMIGGLELNGAVLVPYQSVNMDPTLEKALLNSDARSGSSFTGIKRAGPLCRFTSPALKAMLDISGLNAAELTSFAVYAIKHDAVGVAAGAVHRKWSMTEAVLQLEQIGTNNGHAEVTLVVHGVDDGTNDVWVLDDNVALPTSPRVEDLWYQGPLYIGSTLYRVEQSTVSPNGEALKRHSNGEVGPGFVGIKPPKPTIAVEAADGVLHGLALEFGDNVGAVTMFYRKGSEGDGLRVDDATAEHISLTVPDVLMTPDSFDGTPGQEVGWSVMMDARDDGTNDVWTLDTAVAIAAPV